MNEWINEFILFFFMINDWHRLGPNAPSTSIYCRAKPHVCLWIVEVSVLINVMDGDAENIKNLNFKTSRSRPADKWHIKQNCVTVETARQVWNISSTCLTGFLLLYPGEKRTWTSTLSSVHTGEKAERFLCSLWLFWMLWVVWPIIKNIEL